MAADKTSPLQGVRLLDLSQHASGQIASLILAECGAETVRTEAPDTDRQAPSYAVRNRSKASVSIDIFDERSTKQLKKLLSCVDVLIFDEVPNHLSFILSEASLSETFPHLVSCRITPRPGPHPASGLPIDGDLVLAEAGLCDLQQGVAHDGPIYLRFPLADAGAAHLVAIGVLSALYRKRASSGGAFVETSLLQGALTSAIMYWSRAAKPSDSLASGYQRTAESPLFECADGKWMHLMSPPDGVPSMKTAFAAMPGEELERLRREKSAPMMPNWAANAIVFRTKNREDWLIELWEHDVCAQPVLPMGELFFDEQANVNGYVVDVEDPRLGATRQPGIPISMSAEIGVKGPAPTENDGAKLVESWSPRTGPAEAITASGPPLQGIKVLDLGNFLAGPFAPMIMSTLGADVIKLEATAGDMMRYVDWAFNACQRGKRSLALDLKHPDARPVLEKLVAEADVVHHNLRMPAARKLGIDFESLKAINPKLVYCHISSYGPDGPRKDWPGFDQLFQASAGWEYEGAGEGNRPMWSKFGMMDHHCAMLSVQATLLGLIERDRSGEAQFVATSLLGASLFTITETLVQPDGSLAPYPKLDSRQYGVSPQRRLFECADGWVMAITEDGDSHQRLLAAANAKNLQQLEAFLAGQQIEDVVDLVQSVGGAAVVAKRDQREAFLDNADNQAAGLVAAYEHTRFGKLEQIGKFFTISGCEPVFNLPPPLLGEHTVEVLTEIGMDRPEIDRLVAAGASFIGGPAGQDLRNRN